MTDTAAERLSRQRDLAVALRLFARHGFDLGLAGHITARDPEYADHFWVNPLAVHFGRVRVSDLLLVNSEGRVVVGERPVNVSGFLIHSAVHEARPDVIGAAHAHSPNGKALSATGRLLAPITEDACAFYDDHALYDDFRGVVLDTAEGVNITAALGRHKAVILKNHGLLTAGPSVAAAAGWFIALDEAARIQLRAEAAGPPVPIPHQAALALATRLGATEVAERAFRREYAALVAAEPDVLH
ncbi:class II aldolase/adducin family protein [Zavarzinia compransoris]|uniref:Class II aldolase/adducin family protein n=1 Tax=Zavarzinia compransoris TaxID=1264899 RepID=A0A317DUF1_9PROT|nr:class II aldolase/adducin family protein [Zavarzinia compransoris]PWR18271.1 class II aldolase/adducin family protein [Zavarzinia compransoris]TDP43673.1 ribulose-5-phosphate 4-epimerase/fuculose-1-phosphate aldolase [Zavarzinia compransoris]